jgi:YD repeat-containing protein
MLPAAITTVTTNDGDAVTHTENREYRSDGKVSRIGPLKNTMWYGYFRGYGEISDTRDANGLTTSRKIDPFGREIQTTDENDKHTNTFYERPGPEGAFLTHNNRTVAYATRITGEERPTTINFHDPFGRVLGTYSSDPDGIALATQAFFDSLGRKNARSHRPFVDGTQPEPLDQIHYDNLNRVTSISVASDTGTNSKAHYAFGYGLPTEDLRALLPEARLAATTSVVRTTFPNGTWETKLLDAQSRTVAMIDRNNGIMTYSYGAAGKVQTFTDQANLQTTLQYDRYGRATSVADPIRGLTTTSYSPLGDTVVRTTPTDTIVTHYDLLNRPLDETAAAGTTTWTYDEDGAIGKLAGVAGPSTASSLTGHRVQYTYGKAADSAGVRGMLRRVTNTVVGEQFDVDYDYDSLGRTKTVHYPPIASGLRYSVEYQYSSGGRPSKVVEGDGGQGRALWEITARDNFGRMKTAQSLGTVSVSYAYTDIEGLLRQLTASESGQDKAALEYQYDVEGNVTALGWREDGQFSDKSRLYQYDGGGRFTDEFKATQVNGAMQRDEQSAPLHVEYATNGNILSKSDVGTYTYGELGNPYAATEAGGYTYRYDRIGRQIERTAPYVPSGAETLTWTQFDAPASVTSADGVTTSYEYNGLQERVLEIGLRAKKVRIGSAYQRIEDLSSGQRTHSMLVTAGPMTIAEVEFLDGGATSGTAQGPLVAAIVTDKLGSTTIVRDSSGNYVKRSYDAFGKPSASTNPLKSGLDFAGYTNDSNSNLLWM